MVWHVLHGFWDLAAAPCSAWDVLKSRNLLKVHGDITLFVWGKCFTLQCTPSKHYGTPRRLNSVTFVNLKSSVTLFERLDNIYYYFFLIKHEPYSYSPKTLGKNYLLNITVLNFWTSSATSLNFYNCFVIGLCNWSFGWAFCLTWLGKLAHSKLALTTRTLSALK